MEKYITDKKTKIATVPIGYADGYLKSLQKHGKMIVDGVKFYHRKNLYGPMYD